MNNKKLELINLSQRIEKFPMVEKGGDLVIKNYTDIMAELSIIYTNFDELQMKTPTNNDDFYKLYNTKRTIQAFQKHLKENFLEKLDNEKIKNLRKKTNELLKLLGTKVGTTTGNISDLITKYKNHEQSKIVEIAFVNIRETDNYKIDFEYFTKRCAEVFKGKSNFEEMQNLALIEADNYSNKLSVFDFKYKEYNKELIDFCKQIGYVANPEYMSIQIKELVKNTLNIETVKNNIEILAHTQKAEMEKIIKEKIEKKQELEPKTKEKDTNKTKTYLLKLSITATNQQLTNLKEFLEKNNIEFKKI